ncbi:component of oligomeric golgi complex 2 [Nannochloropsis gaditana]|uniref:Conserved oligomeric Golgi complex subunit 2 n=2 Tax=Nannochloropsis gaditana TaxID=72520 RepID=W7TW36_9STRA|nr:component of oligomeric golgi complex 2 [Nannochloropsis gaditana]
MSTGKYCFDTSNFSSELFDPAALATSVTEVASLEVLRDHLQGYQRDVREELYQVINRDLADYLNLSSRLSGIDAEVLEIRAPLNEIVRHVRQTRDFAAMKRQILLNRLEERTQLENRKAILEKRVRFLCTLRGADNFLAMSGSIFDSGIISFNGSAKAKGFVHDPREGIGPSELVEHCKVLESISQALVSLMANIHCFPKSEEEDGMPTAQDMGLRLLHVEKKLLLRLGTIFRSVICPEDLIIPLDLDEERESSSERKYYVSVNEKALRHCLRAYNALGRGGEAEKHIARMIMLPFVESNFTQSRLDGGARGSCSGLTKIYLACMRYVQRNLRQVLIIGEECAHPIAESSTCWADALDPRYPCLDFVCNSVWRPVQQALCCRLASIFAPGIASILHTNYVASMTFLDELATLTGPENTDRLRARILSHDVTKEFQSRWNLSVYFHLRFSEISSAVDRALDSALDVLRLMHTEENGEKGTNIQMTDLFRSGFYGSNMSGERQDAYQPSFCNPIFSTVWCTILRLWDPDIFLLPLTARFFKLTLQLIGRFRLWCKKVFDNYRIGETIMAANYEWGNNDTSNSPRANVETLVNISWDAWILCQTSAQKHIERHVLLGVHRASTLDRISTAASAVSFELADESAMKLQSSLQGGLSEALLPFGALVRKGWQGITSHVVGQCVVILEAVHGITAQYRMTNKRPPERASPYVKKILGALRGFDVEERGKVPSFALEDPGWKVQVLEAVLIKYTEASQELLDSIEQMEDALRKRKQRSIKPMSISSENADRNDMGTSMAAQALSDSDKIRLQLFLDVAHFSDEIRQVGIYDDPIKSCETYSRLLQKVSAARHLLAADCEVTLPKNVLVFLCSTIAHR